MLFVANCRRAYEWGGRGSTLKWNFYFDDFAEDGIRWGEFFGGDVDVEGGEEEFAGIFFEDTQGGDFLSDVGEEVIAWGVFG